MRLDSRTGQVSQCGWSTNTWSCKVVPDERAALESEIGRLQRDNAALKNSLLAGGLDLPGGVMAEALGGAGAGPAGQRAGSLRQGARTRQPRPISIAPSRS